MTAEFSPSAEYQRNIHRRIIDVMSELKYVQKDVKVSTGVGSYSAVSHDQVTALVRPLLIKHGLSPNITICGDSHFDEPVGGSKHRLFRANFTMSLTNVENPSEVVCSTLPAHAMDSGDKAPAKAASMAMKCFYLKTFALETGDDEESRYQETYDFAGELTRAENAPREEAREIIKHAQAEALRLKDAAAAKAISLVSKKLAEKFGNADKHSNDVAGQA